MRFTYQPVDGPLAQEPLALSDDQFDLYSNQIDITITNLNRIAVYRRRSKSGWTTTYATINGDPASSNDDNVDWSYRSDAVRALIFVGWKG
jgi:hypothetical protein